MAVREAAAAGLPIICTKTAGAAGDVAIDGRNALLVNPYSVDEVAGALERLVADAELRRRMGAESRAIDRETDGSEVDAFADAVLGRRPGGVARDHPATRTRNGQRARPITGRAAPAAPLPEAA